MPRTTTFPPTPAPSTDISGKHNPQVGRLDASFKLPPAAILGSGDSVSSTTTTSNHSNSSYRPDSPTSPRAVTKSQPSTSRKRPNPATAPVDDVEYELPPPPTRSRKIIQMKPKPQETQEDSKKLSTGPTGTAKASTQSTAGGGRKSKANGTTAAGRKIARKTAHSLIERRRRSKMNEEFSVLKNMIPACEGQDMHKLAILQASIEYVSYLKKCVEELKAAKPTRQSSALSSFRPTPSGYEEDDAEDQEEEEDEEMGDAEETSPFHPSTRPLFKLPSYANLSTATASPALQNSEPQHFSHSAIHSATTSPAIFPNDHRQYSYASSVTSPIIMPSTQRPPYNSRYTATPSPNIHAQNPSGGAFSTFKLTSPALLPQSDRPVSASEKEDHEATTALLMLNTDRRSWSERGNAGGGRGMSVKDLLTTP
ncbi:hypothetical protein M501DRAFT_927668 [Patellaria atrata CBS 101060]|uniref:BHLH domain-containing protein n=1 Tax=Patellaria atrata CBS 101060 TaxID=1346257 RepID=A0A9P4SGG4_9PEZI|nr:hypothetical protein M501DRAFT_927668 [Patellaria atrata CBS 101060]